MPDLLKALRFWKCNILGESERWGWGVGGVFGNLTYKVRSRSKTKSSKETKKITKERECYTKKQSESCNINETMFQN